MQRTRLLGRYGITPEELDSMLTKADNKCELCSKVFSGREPHVDHNHTTGKVRGLLCNSCNTGLGHFKEDPELLRKAISYIGRFKYVVQSQVSPNSSDQPSPDRQEQGVVEQGSDPSNGEKVNAINLGEAKTIHGDGVSESPEGTANPNEDEHLTVEGLRPEASPQS